MNRRKFAYLSALASAATATVRGEKTAAPAARIPEAAGLIAEMIFLDDCVRLAMYDTELSNTEKTALTAHPDFVRNGALSPPASGEKTGEKFALAAGRICSEMLNRHRQPNSPEARLYQDIALMRDVSAKAGCDPAKRAPVADLLDTVHVRRRLGLHTLNPDEDIHHWLEGIITWWRDERELRSAIAAAYTSPDAAKMHEFVSGFYNPSDPIIRVARSFEFAQVTPPGILPSALAQARQGSQYARAMVEAVESLRKLTKPLEK